MSTKSAGGSNEGPDSLRRRLLNDNRFGQRVDPHCCLAVPCYDVKILLVNLLQMIGHCECAALHVSRGVWTHSPGTIAKRLRGHLSATRVFTILESPKTETFCIIKDLEIFPN